MERKDLFQQDLSGVVQPESTILKEEMTKSLLILTDKQWCTKIIYDCNCCGKEWFQFQLVYIKEHDHNIFIIVDCDARDYCNDEKILTSSRHALLYTMDFLCT